MAQQTMELVANSDSLFPEVACQTEGGLTTTSCPLTLHDSV